MKNFRLVIYSIISIIALSSCHKQEEYANNPYGNFDALWKTIDERYCFFKDKDLDWNLIGEQYRAKVSPVMTSTELFTLCANMVNELKDGHVNLASSWDISSYKFWENYPQNYNEKIIDQYYLNYNYKQVNGIKYMILSNNLGYMYYGSFASGIGEGNLDNILMALSSSDGLIIDVRDNGGGYLTNVETLVRRFINKRIYAGSISHKTGPGHNDFSTPYDYYFDPAEKGRVRYLKPIVLLTNRSSFSATNNFVSIMQYRDNVKIVGDVTGGGSGLPFTSELPNSWTIRLSACSILDAKGKTTEFGVEPSAGYKIDNTKLDEAANKDAILEKGFDALRTMIDNNVQP